MYKLGILVVVSYLVSGCVVGNQSVSQGKNADMFAGNVKVADNRLAGHIDLGNGNVTIGENAKVKSVEITNGNVNAGRNSQLSSIEITNGNVVVKENVIIKRGITTTNGHIDVANNVQIGESIQTTTGKITVASGTEIKGDIIFDTPSMFESLDKPQLPVLKIEGEITLHGNILLYREVSLEFDNPKLSQKIKKIYLSD